MASTSRMITQLCFYFACCLPLAFTLPQDITSYPLNLTVSGSQAPSLPLAVRNPYLSAWLPGSQSNDLPTAQAEFWTGQNNDIPIFQPGVVTGRTNNLSAAEPEPRTSKQSQQTLGWTILAQVDGKTFTLFGAPNGITNAKAAVQKSINYSSTHTIAKLDAGAASIAVDFFSPVSPNNYLRQSFPLSYVTITVSGSSDVQILSAIDDSWYGQQGNLVSKYQNTGATSVISLTDPTATNYTVVNNMAAWGSVVFATSQAGSSSVSYQSGPNNTVFNKFVDTGSLDGSSPTYATGNLIAFAQRLSPMPFNSTSSVTFAVGQYRDNVVNYLGNDQVGFFKSKYDSMLDTVDGFLNDYESAYLESQTLDKAIFNETGLISSNYTDLTTAAVRQCFGAMEITLPASNTTDTSNPYVFLKEISTNGDVNTVDVVSPTSTILGVMSPDWIKFLLEPIAIFCESSAWTPEYVVHDLGTYPTATGRTANTSEQMFLENTGSFLIMAYQYQRLTGDKTWAQSHAKLFRKFADYLETNGLYPSKQVDTVDSIGQSANQTNLAITSAIGLNAYGALTGNKTYTQTAQSFASMIYTQGLGTNLNSNGTTVAGIPTHSIPTHSLPTHSLPTHSIPAHSLPTHSTPARSLALHTTPTHFTYNYGISTSWGTVFNLFPDQYLDLNTFPAAAVSMQCSWYMSQATSVGIPYASVQNNIANGMWDMWIAATCPTDVDTIIGFEHSFFTNGKNTVPFPDRFYVSGSQAGVYVTANARPTLGTTFALLLGKGVSFAKYLST